MKQLKLCYPISMTYYQCQLALNPKLPSLAVFTPCIPEETVVIFSTTALLLFPSEKYKSFYFWFKEIFARYVGKNKGQRRVEGLHLSLSQQWEYLCDSILFFLGEWMCANEIYLWACMCVCVCVCVSNTRAWTVFCLCHIIGLTNVLYFSQSMMWYRANEIASDTFS